MAAASAVSAIAVRLDYLLLDHEAPARCDGDLRDAVLRLRSEIDKMKVHLSKADARKDISEDLMKGVTQLACDIEDALDSYAALQIQGKSGALRCLFKCSVCSSARRLREDLQIFSTRIDEIIRLIMRERRDSTPQAPQHHELSLRATGHLDEKEKLMSVLLGEPSKLSIIAICGMGGIGKTTLAKSLYNDPLLVTHFDSRAWATVSMEFHAKEILESILSSAMRRDKIREMETMDLMEQLYKVHKGRRYLVVLDDVWSTEAWANLRVAFPDDYNGSRIVITTRIREVADLTATYVHMMMLLTEEESWELLKMKLRDRGTELSPEMEMIGIRIVKECRGLPLAITTISGVLSRMKPDGWRNVLHRLQASQNLVLEDDNLAQSYDMPSSLAQSYDGLPFHLKPCFLYLGHFPPDQAVPVEKLYLLWRAEGLISTRDPHFKKQMEVADDYIRELVYRSLVVMVENEDSSASEDFKSCQLNDAMRDICIQKGKQEEFLEVIGFGNANRTSYSSRRLAIYLNKFKDMDDLLLDIPKNKHIVRSVLFFDTDVSLPNLERPKQVFDLEEFQQTRVLYFDKVDFRIRELPTGTEKLTFLRYLSFGGCYLTEFPASLSNFSLLETLDLRVMDSCVMIIPNVLKKLSNLRHLYLPLAYQSGPNVKLKLDSLKDLQVLENFHASVCDADDLLQLKNLEIFKGIVDGDNMDLEKSISYINGMKSLSSSSLVVKAFDSYSKERRLILATLLECNAIHSLEIEGHLGAFPDLDHGIGSNFTEMVFDGSEFSEDPMPILGKLHNLRSLVLCNNAFIGKKMACSEGDFLALRSLKLATLQYLEELELDIVAMPSLNIFTVEQCAALKRHPSKDHQPSQSQIS